MAARQRKIALINDLSGYGRCSLMVSIPILSAFGIECCVLPTAVLSNHTEFDSWYMQDLSAGMEPWMDEWQARGLSFNAIYSGFLGSAGQAEKVLDFVERFAGPETLVVVDPVLGDGGKAYATCGPDLQKAMGKLAVRAGLLTPNVTELCLLTGTPFLENPTETELEALCRQLSQQGPERIVVTGIPQGEHIAVYVYERDRGGSFCRFRHVFERRPGTGDVFASVLCGELLKGATLFQAVEKAGYFVVEGLELAKKLEVPAHDGIPFELLLGTIAGENCHHD